MSQLSIEFAEHRAARRSDPETSHAAAHKAQTFAPTQANRILKALETHGPRTAHGLCLLTGLTVVQIDRRLPDLKAANLARVAQLSDGGDRTEGGFRVWEAVSQ